MHLLRYMHSKRRADNAIAYDVVTAGVCILIASAVRAMIDPIVDGVPFITFFPAVAAATFLGRIRAGVVTLVVGGIVAAYFWVPPYYSLALEASAWMTVVIYLVLSGLLVLLIHNLHAANQRAQAAENTSQLYAHEMVHRTANLVTLVQAVASMTFNSAERVDEQRRLFNERLVALGKALTAPMTTEGSQDVLSTITEVLRPFGERIYISGQSLGAGPEVAARLALIFHELATNAVKYGALSVADGSVNVTASIEGGCLVINWGELGGPHVTPNPKRRGFGSRLIENSLSGAAGSVAVHFQPAGMTAKIIINKSQLKKALPDIERGP